MPTLLAPPPATNDLTRRRLLTAAGGLALTPWLAGCADDDPVAAAPSIPTPTPSADAFPVTVTHKHGTTEIARRPQRVVSLGFTDHDYLLAFGVVPVGVGTDETEDHPFGIYPWARERLGDARPESLGYLELNYEAIAALRPDLITGLASGFTADEYRLLSEIAPTIAQPADHPDFFAPWQVLTRMAGATLGLPERAEQLVAEVEEAFARAREAHPDFEGVEAAYAGALTDGGFYVENASSPRAAILTGLGLRIPADFTELADEDATYAEVSAEQLTLLDRDVLVWELSEGRDAVLNSPLHDQLDVVRDGREIFIDGDVLAAAMGYISVLSLPFLVEQLVPRLAAALDGDPDTSSEQVSASPAPAA